VGSGSVAGVVRYLSEEWLKALEAAAATATIPDSLSLVVQQVVTDEQGEVAYCIRLGGGRVAVSPGRCDDADITLCSDRTIAADVARGILSAQTAFITGALTVHGDLSLLIDQAPGLQALDSVFAAARAETTG
jgi:hypothetical protein